MAQVQAAQTRSENPDGLGWIEPDGGRAAVADEALVVAAADGDQDALVALLGRFRSPLRAIAHRYFLPGGDTEDLIQEATVGFIKAVRDFRPETGSPFRPFADLCVTRQVISAVKSATRQKHRPLNSAVSLQRPRFSDDPDAPDFGDLLADAALPSPELQLEETEAWAEIAALIDETLSPYERSVIRRFLEGMAYQEIADACGTHVKSVDNALWRVKSKLRRALARGPEPAAPERPGRAAAWPKSGRPTPGL